MDKAAIVALALEKLDAELARYARAAREAQAGATDEQSKAENKYDTRGLEASYLAHGQSRQAAETMQARQAIASLPVRVFADGEPIQPGALVELDAGGDRWWHFLVPGGGGLELVYGGAEITLVTPGSPIGGELLGKRVGDRTRHAQVVTVR